MSGENIKTGQTSSQDPSTDIRADLALKQDSSVWSDFGNFDGERNINDETGKERTFSEFDLYPRLPGESSADYGKRLKEMHQKTAEYLAEQAAEEEASKAITNAQGLRTESYLKSDFGKKELDAEANYGRVADKLAHYVQEGKMTKDHADKLLERKFNSTIEEIDGIRQDFKDSKTGDQEAYEKWLEERDVKEEPKPEKPIESEDKPVEEAPKDNEIVKDTEELNTNKDVIGEAKERLMKELGPIIYDNVMAIIAGEVDRIFSGIKLVEQPTEEEEPKILPGGGDHESSTESDDDLVYKINSKRSERGKLPISPNTEKELTDVQEEKRSILGYIKKMKDDFEKKYGKSKDDLDIKGCKEKLAANQQRKVEMIQNTVQQYGERIGGQKGVDILTNPEIQDGKVFSEWWHSLDMAGQTVVSRLLSETYDFGHAGINQNFINWLHNEVKRKPNPGDGSKAA